jgi:hypothetical protein
MKLTLSLDQETIAFAHELARESNDSISNMVVAFFRNARKRQGEYQPQHPAVKRLYGCMKGEPVPDKRAMLEMMLQKHLK